MLTISMLRAPSGRSTGRPVRARSAARGGILWACLTATALMSGCSLVTGPASAPASPPMQPRPETPNAQAPAKPRAVTKSQAPTKPAPAAQRVAILYPEQVPIYRRLAELLGERLGTRARGFPLSEDRAWGDGTDIAEFDQVVAIGVRAARNASRLSAKTLVFCQVFNFRDYGLIGDNMRGISMLAPPEQQFEAWKTLAPDLRRIGVITGPGHQVLIEHARSAARQQGLELMHRIVQSDKETLYEFKRLVPDIDGLWLLPDERILSHRVLRELMSYSAQHRKQVAAFTPDLLPFGALLSASSVEADIVDQVLVALADFRQRPGESAFRVLPLTESQIEVNAKLARQLGYSVTRLAPGRGTNVD